MGETVNITIYRIVQECLTNVIRHAAATRADILIARERDTGRGDVVRVTVRDNGKGIAQRNERATRFGLMGMRERVQALDGMFQIDNRPARRDGDAVIPAKAAVATDGAEAA